MSCRLCRKPTKVILSSKLICHYVGKFIVIIFYLIREYLDVDIAPSSDKIHQIAESVIQHANPVLQKARSILLVEDIVDSIKVRSYHLELISFKNTFL